MVERDPRAKYAKYRVLPLNIDSDDMVLEVNAEVTGVEHRGNPNDGADPPRRDTGW